MIEQPGGHAYERRWLILGVLCLSLVMIVMGNVGLNIALPDLGDTLHSSFTAQQWMVDAYSLLFAGLLLPAGALGDRFGRKGALQGGLVVFGLASLFASQATHSWQVIAARGVMGVAAAFVMPGTLSILASVFPPRERPKAIAIWAGVAGASVAAGLLMSGYLMEHFWWGSVFLLNVPIVAIALAAGMVLLPTSRDTSQAPLDRIGALLSIAALTSLLFGLIQGPAWGWGDPQILGSIALAVVLGGVFITWERRAPDPMLDLAFFHDERFSLGCISISGSFLSLFGSYFLLTQYLQLVLGMSPLRAGLYSLPSGITQMISAPRSAALVERYGYRKVLTSGLVLIGGGMIALAYLGRTGPSWLVLVGLGVIGTGMGFATAPATGAIIASLPLNKAGVGSAVNDTTRELGGALGIAVLGSLLASKYRAAMGPTVHHLSAADGSTVLHGIGPALGVAGRHGTAGAAIADAARSAFASGILVAMWVGAALTLLGAVIVWWRMPAELRPGARHVPDPAAAGRTSSAPAEAAVPS
ncbi:MAG TPA: MFS transporter [Acidimicrobiales bacterium]|jgi:EmrB/QacA subfamily drug resistance transporter|nr:MFS transporter [Acidimicrobiales bacterium]